jgi:general secretion pathway protein F
MSASTFNYRAIDSAGAVVTGELPGESRVAVLDALSRQGFIPIEIAEASANARKTREPLVRWRFTRSRQANARDLLTLTQSLGSLFTAGLMVDRALIIAGSLSTASAVRRLVEALLHSVRAGQTLSQAFAKCGQKLPQYFVSMVDAGEAGGALASSFARLAELQQRTLQMQERIRSALVYPALLAGVMLLTVLMLLTFVLPRFEQLFAESDASIPWSTQVVLFIGRLVANWWWLGVSGFAASALGVSIWARSSDGRRRLHGWLLRSRFMFALPVSLNCARLLRTLSTLITNGMPLPAALRVARGTLANEVLLEALGQVMRDVQAGETLSQALASAQVFPVVAVQLSRVGEETGHLDAMLLSAATFLEEESHLKLERLLAVAVPLLTILMGLLVAGLIGSVLIGLLSINDLAF